MLVVSNLKIRVVSVMKCVSPVRVQDLEKRVRLIKACCLIVRAFETETLNIFFLFLLHHFLDYNIFSKDFFKAFSFKCSLFSVPYNLPNQWFL